MIKFKITGLVFILIAVLAFVSKQVFSRGISNLSSDTTETRIDGDQWGFETLEFNSIQRNEIAKGYLSSLYPNVLDGLADQLTHMDFDRSSVFQFNQVGSFGLHFNGFESAVKSQAYHFLANYSYQNYDGYRRHSKSFQHVVNMILEASPTANSEISITGRYMKGEMRIPGSLTKDEFEKDPFQANSTSSLRDDKRITNEGRLEIHYLDKFGKKSNNEIEITPYANLESYDRVTHDYLIINKLGLGLIANYLNVTLFSSHKNVFNIRGELLTQPQRTEDYENYSGNKNYYMEQLTSQKTAKMILCFSDDLEIFMNKLFALFTVRYDNLIYQFQEEMLPSRYGKTIYQAITPTLELKYKLTHRIDIYTSYGLIFNPPADNELDSPVLAYLYNQGLKAERSGNFEIGIKGVLIGEDSSSFFSRIKFRASFFNMKTDNELVPYEEYGDLYYRNADKSNHLGFIIRSMVDIYKNLTIDLLYRFCRFTYGSYTALSLLQDSTGTIIRTNRDFSWKYEPNVPKNYLNISLLYHHPIGKKINLFAKLSYSGMSGLWVDDGNSDKTTS